MTGTYPTVISRVFEETEFFSSTKNKTKFPTMKVNSALFNVNSPAKLVRPTPYNKNKIIPHDPLSTVGAPVRCKGMSLIMLPPNNCSWSRSEWLKTNFQLSLPKKNKQEQPRSSAYKTKRFRNPFPLRKLSRHVPCVRDADEDDNDAANPSTPVPVHAHYRAGTAPVRAASGLQSLVDISAGRVIMWRFN